MYITTPVALSAFVPKFRFENAIFLAMKDLLTRLAPEEDSKTARRQEGSMTNLVTSSYTQLSQTPSDARTTHRVLALIAISASASEEQHSGADEAVALLNITSRSIKCTSGRCDTPYDCRWRSPSDLVKANASWNRAEIGVATRDALK